MNSKPKLSVIMPVYNGEKYIREAVESILNQTFNDFEFIIIDDGSTDKTLSILMEYMDKDIRINIISRENKGLIYSLNEGIKLSKGQYIARMDADDISMADRFKKQIEIMENLHLDICGCHYLIIDEQGHNLDCILTPLNDKALLLYLISSVPFAHGSVIFRKSFMIENNLFYGSNAIYAEDKGLWIKFYENGAKFGNVDQMLFKYRDSVQSLSKKRLHKILKEDDELKLNFIKKNITLVNGLLKECVQDLSSLNNRELQFLSDILLFSLFKFKNRIYMKSFVKIPKKFKTISILKFLRNKTR